MSEIITEHESPDAEAQEIELIRGLAEAEGYDPNEVLPAEAMEVATEEAPTEEAAVEASPEPKPPSAPDPKMQDPDYLFKLRHAKRLAEQHNRAHPEKAIPVPQNVPPEPQQQVPQQQTTDDIFRDLGEEPSLDTDPAGHVKWMRAKQMQNEAIIKGLLFERQQAQQHFAQQQQMAAIQQQQTQWVHEVGKSEQEWVASNPDYPAKYEAVKRGLSEVYREQGISEEKTAALVKSEMHGMARLAYDEGVHPCKMVESLHNRMFSGVAKPAPQPRARAASGQFVAAREAKMAGEGVDLSAANVTEEGGLTPAAIRTQGATQRQVEETLTNFGTKGMLQLLERAERGQ